MAEQRLRFDLQLDASCERVFEQFRTHAGFAAIWGTDLRPVKAGEDPKHPDGLGSVRECHFGGAVYDETIVRYEPPRLIEYTVTRGSVVKNHLGRIELMSRDGGTQVICTIAFGGRFPGAVWLTRRLLERAWRGAPERLSALLTG